MNVPNNNTQFNLIPIYEEISVGDSIQTVNARELHEFLEVKTRFNDWIANRIREYGFSENVDFVSFTQNLVKPPSGGRPSKDYHISLDMAKELSMVERNTKGKEARQYFIECERKAKQTATLDLNSPSQLRGLLSNYAERTEIAEAKVIEFEPKALAFDRLDAAEGSYTVRPASKILGVPEKKLIQWFQSSGWAFRSGGKGPLQAYVAKRNVGYLDHKLHSYQVASTGEQKTSIQMVVTPKGMARLAQIFAKGGMS